MQKMIQAILVAMTALWALAVPAAAEPFDDAVAAFDQGDYDTAFELWRQLAEQGSAPAQYNLAFMYDNEIGVPRDHAAGIKWYRLAADQGYTNAQYNLALMYANGRGIAQDLVQAHMWLDIAAAQGDTGAAKDRDFVAQLMTSEQIAKSQRLASEWAATPTSPQE